MTNHDTRPQASLSVQRSSNRTPFATQNSVLQCSGASGDPAPPGFSCVPAPGRRPHHSTRRRPVLSVERIVATAIEVLDQSGVAGMSMRKVAEHLGTGSYLPLI